MAHIALERPARPPLERWAAAVAALTDLQDEYRAWLDNLPPSLDGSRLAEKLHAIAELDLEELQAIDPPRGDGRDRQGGSPARPTPWIKLLNLTHTTSAPACGGV